MMRRLYIISTWFALAVLITSCEWLPEVGSVRLSESAITLKSGETKTITATVEPSGAEYESISWSSSDPTVASVKDGLIRASKIGVAKITASAEGVTSLPCEVTVMSIPVSGVQLDRTMTTINEGESLTLTATIWPGNATDKTITWSSSDEKIATVSSSGKVTAITEGVATIFAQAKDGGSFASCKVTVTAEYVNFPDANFRKYMLDNFDLNKNGKISLSEANTVTEIRVSTVDIETLNGIESLKFLESLIVSNETGGGYGVGNADGSTDFHGNNPQGKLKSLDLSNNKALYYLDCSYNLISELDVSHNPNLTVLNCQYNKLKSINVSKASNLNYLNCSWNYISSLDVSNNKAITTIFCDLNPITELDVAKNTSLKTLWCQSCRLSNLDVSKNTALSDLHCVNNQLTALDVSKNSALVSLWCYNNQLKTLDVSRNTMLQFLSCGTNMISVLDVSKNQALQYLACNNNQLTTLDVSKNTALTHLECNNNQLTALDVSKNSALQYLNCYGNKIATLDMSKITVLTELNCGNNQLHVLDVSKNTELTQLSCSLNWLTALDISKNKALTSLYCSYNHLNTLDVSKNTRLQYLCCNPMYNKELKYLYMASGQTISNMFDVPSYTTIVRR